jgi:hypothetical protein
MRRINSLVAGSVGGRPTGLARVFDVSNFAATSLRCQPRIVCGDTIEAICYDAERPSFFPMVASVTRCPSVSRNRPST